MSEAAVEAHGAKRAKELGIFAIKLGALAGGGWPDHTFFKDGRVAFIEYKESESAPYQPLQPYFLKLLQRLGFMTTTCWTTSMRSWCAPTWGLAQPKKFARTFNGSFADVSSK